MMDDEGRAERNVFLEESVLSDAALPAREEMSKR
jgi:hypothetical protein